MSDAQTPDVGRPRFTRVHVTYEANGRDWQVSYDAAHDEHTATEARSRNETVAGKLAAYRDACETGTAKKVRIRREEVE